MKRNSWIVVVVAVSMAISIAAQRPPQPAAGPRLLVLVVIDQMRFDYLDRFARFWAHGLKRLTENAAVFDHAFYPYLNTVTCPGHATIGTGALPSTHGIIMNEWWQRAVGRRMACTDDPTIASVPYGGTPEPIGHSAYRLKIPTLADRLRAASPQSRVVALSMKPRSSVMLAGHGGSAVTWFSDTNSWSTSSAYSAMPVPEVQAFLASNPVERDREAVWTRAREASEYSGPDKTPYERPRPAWTSEFPHALSPPGAPAAEFYNLWERSPYADDYLGALATSLVRSFRLGQRDVVDFLGVGFSGLDAVGHDFGPDSHEVQDTLIRLDRTLGQLFADLDAMVGRDRYVVALSADHGVAEIPEARKAAGGDAGRVLSPAVRKVAEAAMVAAHGPGPHVALAEYSNIYLTEGTRKLVAADPKALQPLIDAVAKMEGVLRVMPSKGLEARHASADAIERAASLSHFPGESGDVILVLKPNWIGTNSSTATHGSLHAYDQQVPVILMGAPFKPGRYSTPASPADLAPTLASLIKLPMSGIDGKVLTPALR